MVSNIISEIQWISPSYDKVNTSPISLPHISDDITYNYYHYFPRIDIVYLTDNVMFDVVKGIPSDKPNPPIIPDNAMALYSLYIPAYTFNVSDIQIKYNDNKRYTMRDIKHLEERVENVNIILHLICLNKKLLAWILKMNMDLIDLRMV